MADIVEILTESTDVKQYIKRIRSRDAELNSRWGTNCPPTRMKAANLVCNQHILTFHCNFSFQLFGDDKEVKLYFSIVDVCCISRQPLPVIIGKY